jgi:hypothetical protein
LFGHSDGASIALIHSASAASEVAGIVALAPHVKVEDLTIRSIAAAKSAYIESDLPTRLGRHHDDPDSAFWGWNRIWLDPAFHAWNIEGLLPSIRCPILAIQGEDDEYGTMEQIASIARAAPQAIPRIAINPRPYSMPQSGSSPRLPPTTDAALPYPFPAHERTKEARPIRERPRQITPRRSAGRGIPAGVGGQDPRQPRATRHDT